MHRLWFLPQGLYTPTGFLADGWNRFPSSARFENNRLTSVVFNVVTNSMEVERSQKVFTEIIKEL